MQPTLCNNNSSRLTHGNGALCLMLTGVNVSPQPTPTARQHPIVDPLHMLLQLVLPLELLATAVTHELPDVGVPQHVQFEFVWSGELFIADLTRPVGRCVDGPHVFSEN